MLIGQSPLIWFGTTILLLGSCSANLLLAQGATEPRKANTHYRNWKGEWIPLLQAAADGFYRDDDDKIMLAKNSKGARKLGLGGIERQKVEEGYLASNRSKIGKQIKAIEPKGVEKLYLDSDLNEIVVYAVVSDEKTGHAFLVAAMRTLLPLLKDSDVKQAAVIAYLGEKWIPVEGQKLVAGVVEARQFGPVVASTRFVVSPATAQDEKEENAASGTDSSKEQAGATQVETND